MEYLKIAQDLEMYGVSYFEIKVQFFRSSLFKLEYEWGCTSGKVFLSLASLSSISYMSLKPLSNTNFFFMLIY